MEKEKLVLGIDVGIASVGWGIINTASGEIVDAGVRLFSEALPASNADRRGFRSHRRLLRRRRHRLERLQNYLVNQHIISRDDVSSDLSISNPYEIRVKGLSEKLSAKNLYIALAHIAKHRGSDNVQIVTNDKDEAKEAGLTKKTLKKNQTLLKEKYVSELQLERFNDSQKSVRGIENRFTTDDYIKEVHQILSHWDLSDIQTDSICKILSGRRAYYDGPGSKDSPTPYGQWFYDEKGELQDMGMIEKMRGKCSIYPEEFRAPKMSYTAHVFNLLNEINNLRFGDNQKITSEQKKEIFSQYIDKKDSITPLQLAKGISVDKEDIKGFPIKKNGTEYLSPFEGIKKIRKALSTHSQLEDVLSDKKLLDDIAQILTDHKSVAKRKENLQGLKKDLLDVIAIDVISEIAGFVGYHALSLRAMNEILDDLWETSDNQMQIITKSGMGAHSLEVLKDKKNIPFRENEIYSPVARRAERESIKVINAVRKKYGELESIVIEMPRDKNSIDEKNRIKKDQKNFSDEKKKVDELLIGSKEKSGISGKTKLKIRLYQQQGCKCVYSGDSIDLNTLINDDRAYEIDHVIPLSVSFDDSLANKVLCTSSENQKKGQRTPFAYFISGSASRSYDVFKKHVLAMEGLNGRRNKKKLDYLLYEADVSRYDNQRQFINRNLVDTRYASRALLSMVQDYIRANTIGTKVHVVRGGVTAGFRKRAGIRKDRDEDFSHHAIDALIVAGIKKMGFMDHVLNVATQQNKDGETVAIDKKTGEILTPENENEYFDSAYINFLRKLRGEMKDKIKYSHKIDRKPNRKISDQTIYGIREIDGIERIIGKYGDIYGQDGEKVAKLFRDNKAEKLLMYKHDPVTFALLTKIVEEYAEEKNPFATYREDYGEPICKQGKKNGPVITSLRYDSKTLGTYQDISHKYPQGNKVVKLRLRPYRVDMYRHKDGTYKFLRLTYTDVQSTKNGYVVNQEKYDTEKLRRGIIDEYEFQFSLYKNDLFGYTTNSDEKDEKIVRYNGVMYNANRLEWKYRDKAVGEKKQEFLTIGKKIENMSKYFTDVLGNVYRVKKEVCKMEIGMLI